MSDKKLDDLIVKRTAAAMERIEQEIYKEGREASCEHFWVVSIRNLSDDQVKQIKEAKRERDKGFLKLGYNLVLKKLRRPF